MFVIHHRIALKAIAFHQLRRIRGADERAERQRIPGHHLTNLDAWDDNLGDGFNHTVGDFSQVGIGDVGTRTPFFANQR